MSDESIEKDLRTLALFIELYCEGHAHVERFAVTMKTHDVAQIAGKPIELCPACAKLLMHAFIKRSNCPMEPKPACKHCPNHCYGTGYRELIQEVMRYSGRKMVMGGRVDYLLKLLF